MRHLRVFQNFNKDKLISEIETITHILQDENHDVLIREILETIIINVEVAKNIEDKSFSIASPDSMSLLTNILHTIMKLEEMVEFKDRLEEICDKYEYEYEILYDSELIFYITPKIKNI